MSSILDALKKAEQESITDRGAGTPWPAPLPAKSRHRHFTRWGWAAFGIVIVFCVFGALAWKARRPDNPRPEVSVKAAPPPRQTGDITTRPVAQDPKPNVAVAEKNREQPETTVFQVTAPTAAAPPAQPVKTLPQATAPTVAAPPAQPVKTLPQATAPTAAAPPTQPVKTSPKTTAPIATSVMQPPPIPLEKTRPQAASAKSEPVLVPPVAQTRRPAASAEATGESMNEPLKREKNFKSDPRIDLQALVWAPAASQRFVVINNRLIKEGGSVDNIVVVQINQDDVLLSEGSDRWYVEFSVR